VFVQKENSLHNTNKSGIVIRIAIAELRVMGRATQGVRLISLKGDDAIASIAKVEHEEEAEKAEILNEPGDEDPEANNLEEEIDEEEVADEDEATDNEDTNSEEDTLED